VFGAALTIAVGLLAACAPARLESVGWYKGNSKGRRHPCGNEAAE